MKEIDPPEQIIKSVIIEAISKELNDSTDIGLITAELSKLQEEELISTEILNWASTETCREHRQVLESNGTPVYNQIPGISAISYDQVVKMCPPVKLNHDDLYHASLCSTVVNTSNDTEQCKRLLQSLSYKSLIELSLSQPNTDEAAFPRCMIAISSDVRSGSTTCYVAFENIVDYKVWKPFDKSSFGKGIIMVT